MLIKNVKGSTGDMPPSDCSDWQDFWEQRTGLKAKGDVGGHVMKVNSSDTSVYIADITYEENEKTKPYEYSSELVKISY
jgi:hypothetical protein